MGGQTMNSRFLGFGGGGDAVGNGRAMRGAFWAGGVSQPATHPAATVWHKRSHSKRRAARARIAGRDLSALARARTAAP